MEGSFLQGGLNEGDTEGREHCTKQRSRRLALFILELL